ncbi:DUF1007 domain-containing protein [Rhodopseudomonas palustris]|uniref:DUF1007 domain-containing protein n=1 Tax=Rhodopseudomonas palustris TaxID=1076 RepID=A0A323UMP2_RHOPL|nr:DUF1007 family protein [Rhodopseudomonas palustris]PZA12880.1 DUF1007 domain-containing protein [Rhodopseudomonas palustris]
MTKPNRFVRLAALLLCLVAGRAEAHPHVWVTFHSDVLYAANGTMTGVRHTWTFDDMFSAYALQGIHHTTKGVYTRAELAPLAQTNMDSLKEYDFFTFARADGRKLKFAPPRDYWLEYANATLVLHFTLPLATPTAAKSMQIEVYDPSIFVDFEFAKTNPVSLDGAPDCTATYQLPHQPTAAEQLRLSQLDITPLEPSSTYGETFANKILVKCP